MICPSCASDIPTGAKFCPECGTRLALTCPACQHQAAPGAKFCAECGTALVTGAGEATPTVSSSKPALPSSFVDGRYQVKRFLGEGGKKKVYLVHDTLLDREVAFSLIKTDGLDDTGIERIRREAQLMGRLGDHPHIVSLYDLGEERGQPYLVSQLMGGGDVEGLIEEAPEHRPLLADALRIAEQVCQALDYAHRHGVIHRDLKPGNVWLTADGTAKLGDFGLAMALDRTRLSIAGMIVGTVAYMPPEQALGRPSDGRSDLYSLGAMLYELGTGRPPFLGDDPVAVISQHVNTQPVAPSWHNAELPRPLETLILGLLAKAPEDRPESASAVREELVTIRELLDRTQPDSGQSAKTSDIRNPLDRLAGGVFVGRESELARLRSAIDAALGGTGQIVLLAGEPGVGKTRLAEEMSTYARLRGAQVLWSRSYEWQGAPAYWAWVQLIRDYAHARDPQRLRTELGGGGGVIAQVVSEVGAVLPDLPAPPAVEGEELRFRLFDAVASFLRSASRNQPLVLVLDDLHWADAPSLLLLQYVTRELRDSRVLLLGNYRDIEVGRHHPLAETLAELAREQQLERIALRGLTREEIERYIELTAGSTPPPELIDAIVKQTAGNSFFVAEVVRLLVSEGALERVDEQRWSVSLPQGVREVVGRRLDRLSPACNELLAVAAVIGREFDLRLLSTVVEQPLDEVLETLEAALAARVIQESDQPDHYRFNQELIQEVLYTELSIAQRRRLNGAVARAVEEVHAAHLAPYFAALAHHYAAAGPGDDARKAVDYAVRAGQRAMAQAAWETAERHYEQALQILDAQEGTDPELTCRILLALGDARNARSPYGDVPDAREAFQRAADLARQADLPEDFARAALGFAGVHPVQVFGGDAQIQLLDEARLLLGQDDTTLRALVLARLASDRRLYYEDYDAAIALSDEAIAIAERLGDPEMLANVLLYRLNAGWHPFRLVEYGEEIRRYADAGDRTGQPWHRRIALWYKMVHALLTGDVAEARALFSIIEHQWSPNPEETWTPWETRLAVVPRGLWALIDGRLADFEDAIEREVNLASGDLRSVLERLFQLRYEQDRLDEMLELLNRLEPSVETLMDPYLLRAYLLVCWVKSDRQRAAAELRALGEHGFTDIPYSPGWFEFMALVSDACVELDDRQQAESLYPLIVPLRNLLFLYAYAPTCWASAEHYLGRLATVLERWVDAEEHFQKAIEIHRQGGMRLWHAHSQYACADMLVRRDEPGDQEHALTLVDQALAEAEAMGAARLARQALTLKVRVQGILKA